MGRIILHVDMNSYFASVEQQANPLLRGRPIGVTGKRQERSVVAAASREAKKLGVATAMSTWEAKKICPSIILVMGDPEKYATITERFNRIFTDVSDRVERFSVDESFLDVTESAKDYLGAIAIAQTIKARLREECGSFITASIGIAPNRLLAKAASERMKPDGLVVVKPGEELAFMDSCDLQDVCGIGPRIARHLERMGIVTFKQLRACPLDTLENEFKSYGHWLYAAARGLGSDEVAFEEAPPKSVGHSYTLPRDAHSPVVVRRYLLGLADRVAWRLRRDGYQARSLSAFIRYGDFSGMGHERRFKEATADGLTLFKIAWSLIEQSRDPRKPVRLVGLSAGNLVSGSDQPSLFLKERKTSATLSALDRAQRRFGSRTWTRASLLSTKIMDRTSGYAYDHEL
jgi:DNA polymerase-4